MTIMNSYNNNNNNIDICIAPYGRNFRGASQIISNLHPMGVLLQFNKYLFVRTNQLIGI